MLNRLVITRISIAVLAVQAVVSVLKVVEMLDQKQAWDPISLGYALMAVVCVGFGGLYGIQLRRVQREASGATPGPKAS